MLRKVKILEMMAQRIWALISTLGRWSGLRTYRQTYYHDTHGEYHHNRKLSPPWHVRSKQQRQNHQQNCNIRADVEDCVDDLEVEVCGTFPLRRRQCPVTGYRVAVHKQGQFGGQPSKRGIDGGYLDPSMLLEV